MMSRLALKSDYCSFNPKLVKRTGSHVKAVNDGFTIDILATARRSTISCKGQKYLFKCYECISAEKKKTSGCPNASEIAGDLFELKLSVGEVRVAVGALGQSSQPNPKAKYSV